ncbi:hypothetical protein HNO89_002292 [Sporosarcina luteola]|nr:hypothetical protein [Sporosarcina luteola]
MKKFYIVLLSLLSLFLFSACAATEKQKQNSVYEAAVKEKNEELEKEPIKLTPYAKKLGASLTQPAYNTVAANGVVTIEGAVEQHEKLKGEYVMIITSFNEGKNAYDTMRHYAPIEDGNFKQEIRLFGGEGNYQITVYIPNRFLEDVFDDIATFSVMNVNPALNQDIVYTPFAHAVNLSLHAPDSRYAKGSEVFTLQGKIDTTENILLELYKDGKFWSHELAVHNGEFSYDVPLAYGKGIHELIVFVPPETNGAAFNEGTTIYIDNQSDLTFEPIIAWNENRGVQLTYPSLSAEETDLTLRIAGTIDKDAPLALETTHLNITIEKDIESAGYVIPVVNYSFDDEVYLRFGPGTYNVSVNVPEEKGKASEYVKVAEFTAVNTNTLDQRDLLPSGGVQSDAPEIIALAKELISEEMSDREKAKTIYKYTAKTISYDVEKWINKRFEWDDSALKTLDLKSGICGDYSRLAIALLRASGMEAREVVGTVSSGYSSIYHSWVEVKVDGQWLTMDPTWGSGYTIGNEFYGDYMEDYFDPTEKTFKTHTRLVVRY